MSDSETTTPREFHSKITLIQFNFVLNIEDIARVRTSAIQKIKSGKNVAIPYKKSSIFLKSVVVLSLL